MSQPRITLLSVVDGSPIATMTDKRFGQLLARHPSIEPTIRVRLAHDSERSYDDNAIDEDKLRRNDIWNADEEHGR